MDVRVERASDAREGDKFALGKLAMTPGAIATVGTSVMPYLNRHRRGDWGDVDAHDRGVNERAVRDGRRILSAYTLPGGAHIWIITEWDRSVTTVLLPEEY